MFSTECEVSTGYEKPFTSFLPLNYYFLRMEVEYLSGDCSFNVVYNMPIFPNLVI